MRSLSALVGAAIVPVDLRRGSRSRLAARRASSLPLSSASTRSSSGTHRRLARTASSRSSRRARFFLRARAPSPRRPGGPFWAGRSRPRSPRHALLRRSFSSSPRRCGCSSVAGRAGWRPSRRSFRLAVSRARTAPARPAWSRGGRHRSLAVLEGRWCAEGPCRRLQLSRGDRGQRPRRLRCSIGLVLLAARYASGT